MSAVVLDTETTGVTDDDKVIEFACTPLIRTPAELFTGTDHLDVLDARYSSDRPISTGAMAAHHILDEDLVGLRPFTGLDTSLSIDYIVGHNVDFDWRMMGRPKVRRICTLALSRSLWPLVDSHSLTAMAYQVSTDRDCTRRIARGAHSAKTDVQMLIEILLPAILTKLWGRVDTWEQLWTISEDARIPTIMTFGKYQGTPMGDVPASYKSWLLKQPDVDPYLAVALKR
jgi:exodeoxyribonuclease X